MRWSVSGLPTLDTTKRGCAACILEYRMDHPVFLRYRGRWYCPHHWVAVHPVGERQSAHERVYRAIRTGRWHACRAPYC